MVQSNAAETILVRPFRDDDAVGTAQLFFNSVHQGTRGHYNREQRQAWAPEVPPLEAWRRRLKSQYVVVAVSDAGLSGFMSLTPNGTIDLAFVAPADIGKGIAKALYDALYSHARALKLKSLQTHASQQARRFFERQGWRVIVAQTVTRNGVALENFLMEKTLS
jgi:putative acetyltransferase